MTEAAWQNAKTWPLIWNKALLARIVPFILFMSFIGLEESARFLANKGFFSLQEQFFYFLYPVKTLAVGWVLYLYRSSYDEIGLRQLFSSRNLSAGLICGLAVFVLWINMEFSVDPLAVRQGYNPFIFQDQLLRNFMTVMRLGGAVLVVPLMEELFWRSFFLRYLVSQRFEKVPVGAFTWPSFLLTALLFGLEHNLVAAGIMAGIAYNLLLYFTRSITSCILAHALTNLLLGLYVLATQKWYFW